MFAAAATAALIFLLSGKNNVPKADSQAIVYKATDGGTYLSAYGQKHKLTISDDSSVLLTSDGEYLIYTTASAKVSQKYDLYMCSIKSASKAKKKQSFWITALKRALSTMTEYCIIPSRTRIISPL